MNEIVMIPVEQLRHHPKNPRLDLGDLTELAESIRSQGILQNLTIVPDEDGGYLVLIGNRRMEAAKLAGLKALPCAVVEMDETDQIATMLTENMHRTDLTLFEQAQGMQMMMDLGLSEGAVSVKIKIGMMECTDENGEVYTTAIFEPKVTSKFGSSAEDKCGGTGGRITVRSDGQVLIGSEQVTMDEIIGREAAV